MTRLLSVAVCVLLQNLVMMRLHIGNIGTVAGHRMGMTLRRIGFAVSCHVVGIHVVVLIY